MVLAHEMTHALQDQYFDLARLKASPANDENAVTALIEGDAVRVQLAYVNDLPAPEHAQVARQMGQGSATANQQDRTDQVPDFLSDESVFPYNFGPTFLAVLLSEGGDALVDRAFRDPPAVDKGIIDPGTFQPGGWVPPVKAPAVPARWKLVQAPTGLGQVTLMEMLGDQIGFKAAWPVVEGWSNDQYAVYQRHGLVCDGIAVREDSVANGQALDKAALAWASHMPRAHVADAVRLSTSTPATPGPVGALRPTVSTPYIGLAARAALIYQLVTYANLQGQEATCVAGSVLDQPGPQQLNSALQSPNGSISPSARKFATALAPGYASC